jgi:hypothetical protein
VSLTSPCLPQHPPPTHRNLHTPATHTYNLYTSIVRCCSCNCNYLNSQLQTAMAFDCCCQADRPPLTERCNMMSLTERWNMTSLTERWNMMFHAMHMRQQWGPSHSWHTQTLSPPPPTPTSTRTLNNAKQQPHCPPGSSQLCTMTLVPGEPHWLCTKCSGNFTTM